MSKIKLLLDVVSDMRSLADSIQSVADSIAGNTPEPQSADSVPEKHTSPPITIDQVRAVRALNTRHKEKITGNECFEISSHSGDLVLLVSASVARLWLR